MSDYQTFLQERDQIDYFTQKGYRIKNITENLSGAFVEFERESKESKEFNKETLHILTADGRKYFSVVLINQQKEGA
ncbi:hypothetical protein J2Z40_000393 [Cytobacillus eiseniae]|uniref:Uncharacterized protein n=1 Tax=Cytobacillus eiseniae TaxID=762947 RepID=A0ABS4RAC4_9BACI|nr:hypothetical protein [Cytobacillus eiseniae]MBP2239840.1 hypothetical protein [Cytobacillus eiseniae]